ncbi:MAG: DUF4190 domain-containing protein, partial [Bacteroidota bacterium]
IGPKAIKYKRCNNIEGPTIVVNIESVFIIKYANGTKELFKKEEKIQVIPNQSAPKQQTNKSIEEQYNGMAIASIATFILYFTIILAPLPLIFGLIALHQFKKDPEKYKGKWMAIVGVIPGLLALFILFIALLFAI